MPFCKTLGSFNIGPKNGKLKHLKAHTSSPQPSGFSIFVRNVDRMKTWKAQLPTRKLQECSLTFAQKGEYGAFMRFTSPTEFYCASTGPDPLNFRYLPRCWKIEEVDKPSPPFLRNYGIFFAIVQMLTSWWFDMLKLERLETPGFFNILPNALNVEKL